MFYVLECQSAKLERFCREKIAGAQAEVFPRYI